MFTSWMPKLESVGPHIGKLRVLCSIWTLTPTLYDITDDDLKVAGDITDEWRFGQRSDALPWFWQIGDGTDSSGPRMQECG